MIFKWRTLGKQARGKDTFFHVKENNFSLQAATLSRGRSDRQPLHCSPWSPRAGLSPRFQEQLPQNSILACNTCQRLHRLGRWGSGADGPFDKGRPGLILVTILCHMQ